MCDRCLLLGLFNNANSAVDILVTIAKDSVTFTSQQLLKDVVVDCSPQKKTPQSSKHSFTCTENKQNVSP